MDTTDAVSDVRANVRTNTLYLELGGSPSPAEVERAAAETVTSARHLSEGFAVIADLSAFAPPSPEAARPILEAQAELRSMGAVDVVRVVGDEGGAISDSDIQQRFGGTGSETETVTAGSVAEAERLLG